MKIITEEERMYTKSHLLTDLYKVKQDIRHMYNHGGQYLTNSLKQEMKRMVLNLEEIEKVVRYVRDDSAVSGESNNGIGSN